MLASAALTKRCTAEPHLAAWVPHAELELGQAEALTQAEVDLVLNEVEVAARPSILGFDVTIPVLEGEGDQLDLLWREEWTALVDQPLTVTRDERLTTQRALVHAFTTFQVMEGESLRMVSRTLKARDLVSGVTKMVPSHEMRYFLNMVNAPDVEPGVWRGLPP